MGTHTINQMVASPFPYVAIRAIAFKWIRIIFRMWKDKTPYSEAKYLKALQKAGSPLISNLASAAV